LNHEGENIDKATQEEQVSFDDYIETYKTEVDDSIGFIGQDTDFFIELKARLLIKLAEKNFGDLAKIKVLDIGSGVGLVDKHIKSRFANLYGVDVEEGVVAKAKTNNPGVNYRWYDGKNLPFEENSFDLCFAINVVHHVPPALWSNFFSEMRRVLKPGGIAAVFEHNPLNPLTQLAVKRCEFDRDAVLVSHGKLKKLFTDAGLKVFDDEYIIFFPFNSGIFRKIENFIGFIPMGAQHFAASKKLS
jgi:SAM-dependent methyltransferase